MDSFFKVRNEAGPLHVDGRAASRARRAVGLTQSQVADRMKLLGYFLPQPYVSDLELGKYRWGFSERMATALAAALGVGISEITGGRTLRVQDAQRIRELVDQLGEVVQPSAEQGSRSQAA